MKALHQMDYIERAYLLANLFPQHIQNLIDFMHKEAEFFQDSREQVYENWNENHITPDFWFGLIADFQRRYIRNGRRLYTNKKTFRDQLFDGYDALFTIHCLLEYAEDPNCAPDLKQAIHLFFGSKKLLQGL